MNLNLKGFTQLVEDMSAALQSSATSLVDVSVGSVIRAIFEANASVVLWLQWLILLVLQATRAATSTGKDLDSWMADFGVARLPAIPATGIATFSRFTANQAASVPIGSTSKTADGTLSFAVSEDTTLSIWQAATSAYVIPAGVASADLPVVCTTSGADGNVLAGTISVIASSLPGIDQVTNASPLSNGMDSETDQSFRDRFQGYLASRSRATVTAVRHAIASVQQGLHFIIKENVGLGGLSQVGAFLVVVDDGTGYPSTALLADVASAIDTVRPIGTTFSVIAPNVLVANVSLTVQFSVRDAGMPEISGIQNQIATYLNRLAIGRSASITRVAQNAYSTGHGIENVTNIQLNGLTSDIVPPPLTVIKAGHIVVTTSAG